MDQAMALEDVADRARCRQLRLCPVPRQDHLQLAGAPAWVLTTERNNRLDDLFVHGVRMFARSPRAFVERRGPANLVTTEPLIAVLRLIPKSWHSSEKQTSYSK